jgi:hypothetical protein
MSEPLTAEEILRRTQGDKFDPNAAVLESERKELAARAKGTEFVAPAATPAVPVEQREKATKKEPVGVKAAPLDAAPAADVPKFDEALTPSPVDIDAAIKPHRRR